MRKLTRRQLLSTTTAGAAAMAMTLGGIASARARTVSKPLGHLPDCEQLHKTLGYRLGATVVDPALSRTQIAHAIKTAACPRCGTGIAPTGLAFGEHMWG